MGDEDSLSEKVQRLVQDIEGRDEDRRKRDMQLMIEESLSRILEEVLNRKFKEVGLIVGKAHKREHHDHGEQPSSMRGVRSWAAEQVARTLHSSHAPSSDWESMNQSVSGTDQSPIKSPRIDVDCALPSCTPGEEHFGVPPHPRETEPRSIFEAPPPAIVVSQSSDLQEPLPKENVQKRAASSSTVHMANSTILNSTHEMSLSIRCPKSPKVAQTQSLTTGHVPKAWDSHAEDFDHFARRSSVSSQSLLSVLSDSKRHMSEIPKRFTRKSMSKRLPARFEESSFFHMICATIVLHPRFDFFVSVVILANAACMGVSADRQAKDISEAEPLLLVFLEQAFFVAFVVELLLRLSVYRCKFFHGLGCGWNIFDFVLVQAQMMEKILFFVSSGAQTLGFAGVLRLLRLVRIVRLARILRLIKELRVLVSSISNSMKSLAWTLVLMFLMIYSVSLCITQLVTDKRISSKAAGGSELEDLTLYFGSVSRSMLTLFEAITGGVDWDVVVMPLLQEVHPLLALVFVCYVAVALLAIMNVVTGVFVDSVLASARADREQYLLNNAKELFATAEEEMDWQAFKGKMKTPQMLEFFKGIDVDPSEAKDIFALIDWDQSGSINAEQFLNGCVRLQGPSKALETAVLHKELRNMRRDLFRIQQSLE